MTGKTPRKTEQRMTKTDPTPIITFTWVIGNIVKAPASGLLEVATLLLNLYVTPSHTHAPVASVASGVLDLYVTPHIYTHKAPVASGVVDVATL